MNIEIKGCKGCPFNQEHRLDNKDNYFYTCGLIKKNGFIENKDIIPDNCPIKLNNSSITIIIKT